MQQHLWPALLLIAAVCTSGGCTYRLFPSHGGGKRFWREQQVLSGAARGALEKLDMAPVNGKKVQFYVFATGDAGGATVQFPFLGVNAQLAGAQQYERQRSRQRDLSVTGDVGDLDSLITDKSIGVSRLFQGQGAGTLAFNNQMTHELLPFTNDRDLDYLTGLFSDFLIKSGGQVVQLRDEADLEVHLFVDVFGTDTNRYEAVVYRRDELRAVVQLTLRIVDPARKKVLAEETFASASAFYQEHFILTVGPLWQKARLELGPDPLEWEAPTP